MHIINCRLPMEKRYNHATLQVGIYEEFVTFPTDHDPYNVTVTDCHLLKTDLRARVVLYWREESDCT